VLKQPGQHTLKELTNQHRAKKFTTEEKLNLMTTDEAGVCAECLGIGPLATICTFCIYKDVSLGPRCYKFQEEILHESEGICFNCHKIDLNGKICTKCAKGVTTRLPCEEISGNLEQLSSFEENEVNAIMTRNRTDLASWLLDSGATVHVTNDPNMLMQARP
jgi:hypothetical protein